MSADRTLAEIVFAKETELRPLLYECAVVFDARGNILLQKSAEPDTPYEIAFTEDEIAAIKAETGVVFTHNHPQGWKYAANDPRHAGNSFSLNDIELACKAEFAEIRAISPGYRFSMRPPADRFTENDWQAIALVFQTEYDTVNREMTLAVVMGHLEIARLQIELLHEAWEHTASVLGLLYERRGE